MENNPKDSSAVPGVAGPDDLRKPGPRLAEEERPRFALENHEDEVYHDARVGELGNEPEYCAFLNKAWVFNRRMRWLDTPDGNIICCCEGGDLPLTGTQQASEWFSDPANEITNDEESLRFTNRAARRRRDCVVLPAFQFHVGQHPLLELDVSESSGDWQFCVLIKGRGGPPMLSSDWRRGAGRLSFDIAGELRKRGYQNHHAELHFAMGVWCENAKSSGTVRFKLRLVGAPAVIACLPVIRTEATAAADGVPVAAVAMDGMGKRLGGSRLKLTATIAGRSVPLVESNGVWVARLHGLPKGDHRVRLAAEGVVRAESSLDVRVTDGEFFTYDHSIRSLVRDGTATGPMSGSYQGTVFFEKAGQPEERMVQGQAAWDAWDRGVPPGEHFHYWEALTEAELNRRFGYLRKCGWNLTHLCQHWGVWERLDAGGRIAPHGAEQLAAYLRTAARHGIHHIQALSHYPYGEGWTLPYKQHYEAGFTGGQWTDPSSPFTKLFHGYLHDFASLFRDEPALLGMTASGEGDFKAGRERVNDTIEFVRSIDRNHLFLAEPIWKMEKLPAEYGEGWNATLMGARSYWIGDAMDPELDLGIEFKLLQTGRLFMGEGCWPCPPRYAAFHQIATTWCGTPRYRLRVRDTLYLGLVHRCPILMTWDEQHTEDERIVFDQIRRSVDWRQTWMEPPVAVRIDSRHVLHEGRAVLAQYEEIFMSVPIAACYFSTNETGPATARLALDARHGFQPPSIPEALRNGLPLSLSPGYAASYLWSADKRTLLVYLCNRTHHVQLPPTRKDPNPVLPRSADLAGLVHREPKPADLSFSVANLPGGLRYRLYDLNDKALVEEGRLNEKKDFGFDRTEKDYFLLITP